MKVGDKVFCIKLATPIIKGSFSTSAGHIIGKTYSVLHIQYHTDMKTIDIVFIETESTFSRPSLWGYEYSEFKNSFITSQEVRKLKLKKLNERR